MKRTIALAALGAVLLAPVWARAAASVPAADDARFDRLVTQFYAADMAFEPTRATELGLHAHDTELEDYSAAGRSRARAFLHDWQGRFGQLTSARLSPEDSSDLELLQHAIAARLLELEQIQGWRHRPNFYTGLASYSIYVLIQREFAPPAVRLRAVIAREREIPLLLKEARHNLDRVDRVSLEITLDELPGIIGFFRKDVPSAFAGPADPTLRAALGRSTAVVGEALAAYGRWLRHDIEPHAHNAFALGETLFREKLADEEMIDTPIDVLLARGEAELHRLQAAFKATCAKIDPHHSCVEVQAAMQRDHARADRLIPETRASLEGLQQFLVTHGIVTLPSLALPRVEETPPFMRATTLASMETPGPFETHGREAFYNITLPDPRWSKAQQEDFLRGSSSRRTLQIVSIHEVFPGHYVQFLWLPKLKSIVRRYEAVDSNVEGWAHYCEQMMLDEGYGSGDPRLRLAQLQDALLRAGRYVVGIRLHTRGMTLAEAVDLFQHEAYQSHQVAELEARRGTQDPTYLYYTLGKLEILRLRADYRRKLGSAFTLRKFHDAFLAEGPTALPLVRQALLGHR